MLSTPCGTRDFNANESILREELTTTICNIFKKYNGQPLETPMFEKTEYLMKKYGDDTKLVYELKEDDLCLRYDLTVPLARYLAQNNIVKLRRYQIGKVFRRDQPSKARFREFQQCDFDIIGESETMIPEIQLLKMGTEILNLYNINFLIKFNFRDNLIKILELSFIDPNLYLTICSSLDKLDKKSWNDITNELIEKGLSNIQINNVKQLLNDNYIAPETQIKYDKLLKYAKLMEIDQYVKFEVSLARGMDYYTGLIFEFVVPENPDIGTIIAGGRYDNLTQMFKDNIRTPAIGLSVGFERLYLLSKNIKISKRTIVYLASITKGCAVDLTNYKLEIYNQLLKNDNVVILDCDERPLSKQIQNALDANADYLIFIGGQELLDQTMTVKDLKLRTQRTIPYMGQIY